MPAASRNFLGGHSIRRWIMGQVQALGERMKQFPATHKQQEGYGPYIVICNIPKGCLLFLIIQGYG